MFGEVWIEPVNREGDEEGVGGLLPDGRYIPMSHYSIRWNNRLVESRHSRLMAGIAAYLAEIDDEDDLQ